MRTLALTGFQLRLIRQTAATIPFGRQQQFFAAIEDKLLPLEHITDDAVEAAIADTIQRLQLDWVDLPSEDNT